MSRKKIKATKLHFETSDSFAQFVLRLYVVFRTRPLMFVYVMMMMWASDDMHHVAPQKLCHIFHALFLFFATICK